jgi:hypothetical protein
MASAGGAPNSSTTNSSSKLLPQLIARHVRVDDDVHG